MMVVEVVEAAVGLVEAAVGLVEAAVGLVEAAVGLVLEWASLMSWTVFGTTSRSLTSINTEAVGTIDLKYRHLGSAALILQLRLREQKNSL